LFSTNGAALSELDDEVRAASAAEAPPQGAEGSDLLLLEEEEGPLDALEELSEQQEVCGLRGVRVAWPWLYMDSDGLRD
jgi:DNA transposition AAA+ family ATPase